MENSEHYLRLKRGIRSWNSWRKRNPNIIPNLRKVDLRQANLKGADLRRADLRLARLDGADLSNADLRLANLTGANLSNADLSRANLSQSISRFATLNNCLLIKAELIQADFRSAKLMKANLNRANLRKADLSEAHLSFADFSYAVLIKADLSLAAVRRANLRHADLQAIRALGTDFGGAVFYGANIRSWSTNKETNLSNVKPDFIQEKNTAFDLKEQFTEVEEFQPQKVVHPSLKYEESLSLFFAHGMPEFLSFFEDLQQRQNNVVFLIQEIAPKENNSLSVVLKPSLKTDRILAKKQNEEHLRIAKATYDLQKQTQSLNERVILGLLEITKSSLKPFNLISEVGSMANSQGSNTFHFYNPQIGNFASGDNVQQHIENQRNQTTENTDAIEVVKEVQMLLDQLSLTYPTSTERDKQIFANTTVQCISRNTELTQRIFSAFRAGSFAALEQFLNHPAASFVVAALENWKKQV